MAKPTLSDIQAKIDTGRLSWRARTTSMSRLRGTDAARRLGLAVPEGERDRITAAVTAEGDVKRRAVPHSDQRDWRNSDGASYVTAIRDQGGCGSCVSFATVATIESQALIEFKAPTWAVDLSEAELFFCGGAKCADGWWPPEALKYAAAEAGLGDEACMPYNAQDQACNIAADKPARMLRVGDWQEIAGVDQRKGWLDSTGPLVACLAVYEDFFHYGGGIYQHATGDLVGYHAVSCVGFNDTEKYWLCKNSWGADWGDGGFFKIAYGEAEIDTSFAMYGVSGITGTLSPDELKDEGNGVADYVVLRSDADVDVLWAHVEGKWRHFRVAPGRLAEISETAFAANPVRVTYQGETVVDLSSWKSYGGDN